MRVSSDENAPQGTGPASSYDAVARTYSTRGSSELQLATQEDPSSTAWSSSMFSAAVNTVALVSEGGVEASVGETKAGGAATALVGELLLSTAGVILGAAEAKYVGVLVGAKEAAGGSGGGDGGGGGGDGVGGGGGDGD
jgi:hypothetical protein